MNSFDQEENFEENTVIETSDLKGIFPDGANITNCQYIKDIDAFHCKDWYSSTLELDLQDSSLNKKSFVRPENSLRISGHDRTFRLNFNII